jgi:folate-binding Fe-S cluster repair protein YgfZ
MLATRTAIQVSGNDAKRFLQSLTTNDLFLLDDTPQLLYTAFLNAKVRIIAYMRID